MAWCSCRWLAGAQLPQSCHSPGKKCRHKNLMYLSLVGTVVSVLSCSILSTRDPGSASPTLLPLWAAWPFFLRFFPIGWLAKCSRASVCSLLCSLRAECHSCPPSACHTAGMCGLCGPSLQGSPLLGVHLAHWTALSHPHLTFDALGNLCRWACGWACWHVRLSVSEVKGCSIASRPFDTLWAGRSHWLSRVDSFLTCGPGLELAAGAVPGSASWLGCVHSPVLAAFWLKLLPWAHWLAGEALDYFQGQGRGVFS